MRKIFSVASYIIMPPAAKKKKKTSSSSKIVLQRLPAWAFAANPRCVATTKSGTTKSRTAKTPEEQALRCFGLARPGRDRKMYYSVRGSAKNPKYKGSVSPSATGGRHVTGRWTKVYVETAEKKKRHATVEDAAALFPAARRWVL